MCGKRLLSLLVFLVLFSPLFSQSPAEMTDAEIIAELMSNLEKRETLIKEKEARLNEREQTLIEKEAILEQRKQLSTETANFWKNYKKDTLESKIIIGSLSFLGGFLAGNYTGFTLGVSVGR